MKNRSSFWRILIAVVVLGLFVPLSMAQWGLSAAPMSIPHSRTEPDTPTPDAQEAKAAGQVSTSEGSKPLDEESVLTYLPVILSNHPRMAIIPAGEFQMGCDHNNPNEHCYDDEQPLHTVYLDEYAIDRYEVTNAQYAEFLNVAGNQQEGGYRWLDDASASDARIHQSGSVWQADVGYEDHPVVEVTWYGARAYCEWLGKRLPTEAEWEKAARGLADTRMHPWGNEDPDCSLLNYDYSCVGDTTPVGSYPSGASPYGILDMAGNVAEWVNDRYDRDYYSMYPVDGWPDNPTGPESGSHRVMRGGGWCDWWAYIRVAWRFYPSRGGLPYYSDLQTGFRCAAGVESEG